MKSSLFLLLTTFFVGIVAAQPIQTDANKQLHVDDGRIVMHQTCNPGTGNAEVSSLKKEVEMLRKEVTQRLDKSEAKGKLMIFFSQNLYLIFAGVLRKCVLR